MDQALLDLPNDLLKLVVSHLPLKDNIVASLVCKTLQQACVSVRLRVADKSPWLMSSLREDGSYQLYDLSMGKIYNLKVPEIFGFHVWYSKHGWLLMYHPITNQIVFFNPFTRDRISLPPLHDMVSNRIPMDFSCAPTSSSCVLFKVSNLSSKNIDISTCSPNAKEWNRFVFKNELPQNCSFYIEKIVFSNGVFYCLTDRGCLTSFDPSLNSWNILSMLSPTPPEITGLYWYMTEHQGKIFLVYRQHSNCMEPLKVLKLDQTSWEWIEKRTLGGLTIYASAMSTETTADQKQPNCLCFYGNNGSKRTCICAFYKIDEKRGVCIKSIDFDFFNYYETTWVSPPLNLPLLDQSRVSLFENYPFAYSKKGSFQIKKPK